MSNERRRAREAREAAAALEAERAAAAAAAARRPSRRAGAAEPGAGKTGPGTRGPAPRKGGTGARRGAPARQTVYRQRRFPPLPWRLKAALALGWLTVVLLGAYLSPTWLGRLGIAVVATFCQPLIVVIVRDPTRRTSR